MALAEGHVPSIAGVRARHSGSRGCDSVKEITSGFVAQFLQEIDSPVPQDLYGLAVDNEKIKKILPIIADLFINKLKMKNPGDFLRGIIQSETHAERDFRYYSPSEDSSVIDVGCGWGAFTRFLCDRCREVTAIDWVVEHAVATKILCPEANVFWEDARDMHSFDPDHFDTVFARSIIEHVGDPALETTGKSVRNLYHQSRLMKNVSRICKPGGRVWLSTGNYLFPRDGEINAWFYHWLPEKQKREYCTRRNISTDNYWLLSWQQIDYLLRDAGLAVESVSAPDMEEHGHSFLDDLHKAFSGLDPEMVGIWKSLIENDPRFFHAWNITARKAEQPGEPHPENDRCCYCLTSRLPGGPDSVCEAVNALVKEWHDRTAILEAEVDSLRAETLRLTGTYGCRTERFLRRLLDFREYDAAYQMWKDYRKKRIDRDRAMREIDGRYGIPLFFLFYPLYKIIKPFIKARRWLERTLGHG